MMNKALNVAYFANQFADREGHGLARYARQLHEGLKTCPGIQVTPVAAWSSCETQVLEQLKRDSDLQLLPWGRRWTPLAWTFAGLPTLEHWMEHPVDLVHSVSLGYPVATRKPYVVTVHDIGPLTHPEFFISKAPWIMKRSFNHMIRKADAIICVSEATADEVVSYAGKEVGLDRIHIIGEGVSSYFFVPQSYDVLSNLPNMPEMGTPFILSTGKISPRKNIHGVIKALSTIMDDVPHHLVLVGGTGWEIQEVKKALANNRVADRVHMLGYVTDEQLVALYNSANAYIHPSLFEGFGLTVLEAMAAGCPVITSNLYSLPEVAGDAAILVNPYDTEEIAQAISEVCLHSSVADGLIKKGRARSKYFNWDEVGSKVADIYRSIA